MLSEEVAFERLQAAHPNRIANLEKLAERYRKLRRALQDEAR